MVTLPISDIIRDAFKLVWKYKYLWLFGLFAAGSGGFNMQLPGGRGESSLEQLEAAKEWVLAALAAILLIGLTIGLIVLILHVICKSALIYNVYQIETNGAHSLGGGWDFGLKRFWQMLGLTLLEVIVMMAFVIVIIVIEVILFVIALPLGFLSLLPAIPALIAGVAVISVTWSYAERFVTLESDSVISAIGDGWRLAKEQWKPTLLVLLVKIAIAIGASLGIMGIGAVLFLPAIPMWFVSHILAIVYGVMILLPFAVLVSAFFGTFDSTVWTKSFLLLRAPAYAAASGAVAPPPPPPPAAPPPSTEDDDRPSPPMFE